MEGRVLVDADSCPKRVRNWLLSQAKKNHIQLIFAANKDLSPKNGDGVQDIPNFKMIKLPAQSQAADNWILQNAAPGDLVITRDIPLAASLLEKGIAVMNDFGKVFDKQNIVRALKERELSLQMSQLGLGTKKRDSYGQEEFEVFAAAFNKIIQE